MKGTIKFVDAKTEEWGYILPDDKGEEVRFDVKDFKGNKPTQNDRVEFGVVRRAGKRHALSPKLLESPHETKLPIKSLFRNKLPKLWKTSSKNSKSYSYNDSSPKLRDAILQWADFPLKRFTAEDGSKYSSGIHYLAKLALPEKWHFGKKRNPRDPYPILENYLRFTFYRLKKEDKIIENIKARPGWASFNTGLVDRLYDPIYALFKQSVNPSWCFYDFCIPGQERSGKILTSFFDPLPKVANYFDKEDDKKLMDTDKDIYVNYKHVIIDGIANDRIPYEFLLQHNRSEPNWRDLPDLF